MSSTEDIKVEPTADWFMNLLKAYVYNFVSPYVMLAAQLSCLFGGCNLGYEIQMTEWFWAPEVTSFEGVYFAG